MNEESYLDSPIFGNGETDEGSVKKFYQYWLNFQSSKVFAFADTWDEREAGNRYEQRFIQKENQRQRSAAKNRYLRLVRELVEFVQKNDQRYQRIIEAERQARIQREKEEQRKKEDFENQWKIKKQ